MNGSGQSVSAGLATTQLVKAAGALINPSTSAILDSIGAYSGLMGTDGLLAALSGPSGDLTFSNPTQSFSANSIAHVLVAYAVGGTAPFVSIADVSLENNSNGSLSDFNFSTSDNAIRVNATDIVHLEGLGLSDFANFTNLRFAQPTTISAHDDAYVTLQGNSLSIEASSGVLFNDDTVLPAIAALVTGPAHGTLQLTSDGGFSYTPTPGFTGIDAFTYSGGAESGDATALIYVVPVISGTLNLLALTPDEQIAATYTAFLGRGADAAGFKFWENAFATESQTESPAKLIAGIASSFASSDEAKALYPLLANPTGASGSQITGFVNDVYENLFNRSADAGGLTFWSELTKAEITAGNFDGSIVVQIMSGAQGQDITTLISKVAVSLAYVQDQLQTGIQLAGVNDLAVATALIHAVTSDPQTVLIGISQAHAFDLAHTWRKSAVSRDGRLRSRHPCHAQRGRQYSAPWLRTLLPHSQSGQRTPTLRSDLALASSRSRKPTPRWLSSRRRDSQLAVRDPIRNILLK